jgi:branched-chain amino acid transport system substrate-binding protein
MTGSNATFGAQFKLGAEAAVADINAKGGVLGKKLKLEIGDDACDPKQAKSVAEKLASSGVKFVSGHFCSGSSIPASTVYAEQGVLQISPASTNPKFTDERAGPSIFRVCGRDDQQGGVAGKYIATKFNAKNVAILHDKTAYGKGLADETQKAMNAAGKKEALYEAYTAGEKDYTALVSKLKQAKIDIVYLGGYHSEGGLIVRQMRAQGMKDTVLMGGDALVTQEYWQITGKDGEGTLMTFSPDPRKSPAAADLVKKFRANKVEPEGYVLYTYAAYQVWQQAAEKAKSADGAKVAAAMKGMTFKTVIGDFSFDAKGDPNLPPYAVYIWKNGNYEQM